MCVSHLISLLHIMQLCHIPHIIFLALGEKIHFQEFLDQRTTSPSQVILLELAFGQRQEWDKSFVRPIDIGSNVGNSVQKYTIFSSLKQYSGSPLSK